MIAHALPSPPLSHPVHSILQPTATPDLSPEPVFEQEAADWLAGRIAFTISNLLTPQECTTLVTTAESIGFQKALLNVGDGVQELDETYRKSGRCIIDSNPLSEILWERIKQVIPHTVPAYSESGEILLGMAHEAVSVNERLRILKYLPGDKFLPHFDGCYIRPDCSELSILTLQVYLQSPDVGGETTMWSDWGEVVRKVKPVVGQALVFSHDIEHEGSEVLEGVKYVVRTDIMYKRVNVQS
ncbi:UNVERIFIED_CONTAM: hypothetical protein HDU68_004732 [Siphonaria sp. JEL0065]|nr:hypothetical protein HDU68_004732 [Siphonaria sp. JEL0065]